MTAAVHALDVAKPTGRPYLHGEPTTQVPTRIPNSLVARLDAEIEATGMPVSRPVMIVTLLREALNARDAGKKRKK